MASYSPEFREKIARQLLPPYNRSVASMSRESGVSEPTLHAWKKQVRQQAQPDAAPASNVSSTGAFNAKARLGAIVATAAMNEIERSAWCREQGLYVHQLDAWRQAFESMDNAASPAERRQTAQQRKHISGLQKELARKDKALAEAAALLVLSKKAQALWDMDVAA